MAWSMGLLGAAGAAGGSYDLLETSILSSNAASVTFSNLGNYASDYQHLQLRITARGTGSFAQLALIMTINGSGGSNHALFGQGSTVNSSYDSGQAWLPLVAGGNNATGCFGAVVADILDPFSTSKNKVVRGLGGVASAQGNIIEMRSLLFQTTSSVTSIGITPSSGNNLAANSRFSLYGLRKV